MKSPPERHRREAVAVCGAGVSDLQLSAVAEELGARIVAEGLTLICGGMGGVMEAAARGGQRARAAGAAGLVVGILPVAELDGGNAYCDVVIPTGMGTARNVLVVRSADVVILVGGGAGTLIEASYAWQIGRPIVALRATGGWAGRLAGEAIDDRRGDRVHSAATPQDAVQLALRQLRSCS